MKKIILLLFLLCSHLTYGQFIRPIPFVSDINGSFWSNPMNYLKTPTKQIQDIQNLNINEIRGNDSNPGGCADIDSVIVRTTGVVYGKNFRQSNNGLQLSLVDTRADTLLSNRCGIGLYKFTMDLPVTLNEGDSIRVVGFVNCFRGLSQIRPDTIQILKTGCQLKQPRVVNTLNEISESYLVKILNAEFMGWNASPPVSGFTVKAFIGTPGTVDYKEFDVRIDNDCDLYGLPMPVGKVDIVGIGGQFSTSSSDGYQILPRSSSDITPSPPQQIPVISFGATNYLVDENSTFTIPINSSIPVTSQISCLIVPENVTTESSDYQLQEPNLATLPVGTSFNEFAISIPNDGIEEGIETFKLKLKKLSNDYIIGSDSIATFNISGSLSNDKLISNNFYFYKNGNEIKCHFPNDFKGDIEVFDSFGRSIISSSYNRINDDFTKINNHPCAFYRIVIHDGEKRFVKTLIK